MINFKMVTSILITTTLLSTNVFADEYNAEKNNQLFKFKTIINAEQMINNVITSTTGKGTISFDKAMTKVNIRLDVFAGTSITSAHIHCSPAGLNGGVAIALFANPDGIDVDGTLVEKDFTNKDIKPFNHDSTCGVNINNVASLFAAAKDNRLYFNVHSAVNPAIRGQIFSH